jgi:Trk-type K+ transport system membrane component
MIMMYISVYPIAMSIRNTNVYEEKSLGIYSEEDHEDHHSHLGETRFHVV